MKLYAAKEWEKDFDFTAYNHAWWIDGIFTEDAVYYNTKQTWALFEKYGQKEYLESVIDLLRAGKHFGIDIYYYDKYDIRYMMNEHSRKLGVLNKSHSIMAGGIAAIFIMVSYATTIVGGWTKGYICYVYPIVLLVVLYFLISAYF